MSLLGKLLKKWSTIKYKLSEMVTAEDLALGGERTGQCTDDVL